MTKNHEINHKQLKTELELKEDKIKKLENEKADLELKL